MSSGARGGAGKVLDPYRARNLASGTDRIREAKKVRSMWQCECGEFNNDDSTFCVRCNKLRVIKQAAGTRQRTPTNTETLFRRIQDFILLDIAFTALVVVYCFWRASQKMEVTSPDGETFMVPGLAFEAVIPLLLVMIFQIWVAVYLLRAFYRTAINSERNSIFLQKIYEKYEGLAEEEEGEAESAAQSVVKPPVSKERRAQRDHRPSRDSNP